MRGVLKVYIRTIRAYIYCNIMEFVIFLYSKFVTEESIAANLNAATFYEKISDKSSP